MKKLISMALAAVLTLSLTACGNKDTKTKELSIGETITTDVLEFSLERVEFAEQLKYATFSTGEKPDTEYLLPTDEVQANKTFVAEDGYTYLSYSYALSYTGKEELEVPTAMGITVDYNDGYVFEVFSSAYMWSDWISIKDTTKLKPLSPDGEGRGCVKVPTEVSENTSAPLKITVSVPDGNGDTVEAVYKIR